MASRLDRDSTATRPRARVVVREKKTSKKSMSTRAPARRRATRAEAREDGVDKEALLTRARAATVATYGAEARGATEASSSAGTWAALRGGVAALACARAAFEESFEAVVVRPAWMRRARRGTEVEDEDEEDDEAVREAAAREAARQPWDAVRAIFAREKVPANAISIERMARGDFQATFDAMAMMYWVEEVRKMAKDGDEEGAAALEISFARRLDPAVAAYCQSEEMRERTIRLARRRRAVMKKQIRRPSVASMASASSMPSQISAPAETKDNDAAANGDPANGERRARDSPVKEDGSAGSESTPMTIDQWELVTELRWELEKTKETLEAKERELERLRADVSTTASPRSRSKEATLHELVTQLAAEREERARVTQDFEEQLRDLRAEIAEIMNATILSPNNVHAFNCVDVTTEHGRALAQTMMDVMDRVRKSKDDIRRNFNILSPKSAGETSDEITLSPSFVSRLDTFELSESTPQEMPSEDIPHSDDSKDSLSIYDSFE